MTSSGVIEDRTITNPLNGHRFEVGLIQDDLPVQSTADGLTVSVPVYDDRYLDYLVDWVKYMIDDGWDMPILYTGERRVGKTNLGSRFARRIDPKFPVSSVSFRLRDFRRTIRENPRPIGGTFYPQAWLDESAVDLYKGDYATGIVKGFVKKATVMGVKGAIWHMLLPQSDQLATKVYNLMRLWFWVGTWKGTRGYVEVREGIINKWTGKRYWNPWAVFMFDPVPNDDPWWVEYSKAKDLFVDAYLAEDDEDTPTRAKQVEQRDRAIRLAHQATGATHSKLAQDLKMAPGTVSRILSKH